MLKSAYLPDRPWSWQIVDLKRHTVPLLTSIHFHATFSHHVQKVVEQLRDYSEFFDNPNNQEHVLQRFGYPIRQPKLVAVIGRLPHSSAMEEYAKLKSRLPDVSIMTYDEILEDRKFQVERWAN